MMKITTRCVTGLVALAVLVPGAAAAERPFRPPAVPLVVVDPYFSTWSFYDRLTDGWPTHWTGRERAMAGMIRVDGKAYRFLGTPGPAETPAARQTELTVHPTRTVYRFEAGGVRLELTFLTPALPDDLEVLARPVTYVIFDVQSADRHPHAVSIYFDASAQWVVNSEDQQVIGTRVDLKGDTPCAALRLGSKDQPVLAKAGDDLRIDWGYFYLAVPGDGVKTALAAAETARERFAKKGSLPEADDGHFPRAANDDLPVMAGLLDLGKVTSRPVSRFLVLAYDDLYSIEYFHRKLRPYWRRGGMEAPELLAASLRDFQGLRRRCEDFDAAFWKELREAGGPQYARLCALAYRQCLGAHKLVADADGTPLYFSKECFSNGCIATVDVSYPSAPFFLRYNTTLLKGQLIPVFTFARNEAWKFPFAPHDVGTYPKANGQVYGGNRLEGQMPVEESGNMLLMTAAVCRAEKSAAFAAAHWDLLTRWAEYLRDHGLDPANQLCTADMFGHLPHNADLSLKAINALGAYAMLCRMLGKTDQAAAYRQVAENYAKRWQQMAAGDGHTRLAFDRPGTWGMKHNLVWDRVLGLGLFPDAVGEGEVAWYLAVQNRYGLPCDNRTTTSLIDWDLWCASLARNGEDFQALVAPLVRYADETPSRVPLSDWFFTTNGRRRGFQARSVVGGLFMRLHAPAQAGAARVPVLKAVRGRVLLPTATEEAAAWRYTTAKPGDGWEKPDFDDSAWKRGPAGFGTRGTPGAEVGTTWDTHDVWVRTAFEYDGAKFDRAAVRIHHDEDATVYLNGTPVLKVTGWTTDYELLEATDAVRKSLRKGHNVVAATCHQTTGGQYLDVGLVLDPKGDVQPVVARPPLPKIKPLFDYPVRDTSVCLGGDGNYYLTGTTGFPTWWKTNEGIRVWRSADLKKWEPLGLVWKIDDGTRQKQKHGDHRALWAPEIHYFKGAFWLTHCMNFGGTGLLKSTTGKAEGPYVDVHPQGPLTGNIDASLFEDDDGKVYFVWQNGLIARMNAEMTDLAEKPRLLKPSNYKHVGFEGAYLTKKDGRSYLICADFLRGQYDCMVASSDKIYGPYGPRYVSVPHGGHNMFFTDRQGHWWATFFGNDPQAPFRERPAMLRIELDDQGPGTAKCSPLPSAGEGSGGRASTRRRRPSPANGSGERRPEIVGTGSTS